jgi:hypothetical protein
MANTNIARGLVPVRHRNGAPYNGAYNVYYVPASDGTALYVGDPVKFVTDSSDAGGIQTVTAASAGNPLLGAVVGLVTAGDVPIAVTRDSLMYRAASTAAYVLVADDPTILFEIQEDGDGGVMTVGAVGRNADLVSGTGNTNTGRSGWQLDSSTLGTGSAQVRIVAPVQRPDNDPTSAYAKWLVYILEHAMLTATGV